MLLIFTVVLGVGYPLLITGIAQLPGPAGRADGSLISAHGKVVGSQPDRAELLRQQGQSAAAVLPAAALGGRRTATTRPPPAPATSARSRSSTRCPIRRSRATPASPACSARSARAAWPSASSTAWTARRPFCTADGVGAVLAVFWSGPGYAGRSPGWSASTRPAPAKPFLASYRGVQVAAGRFGADYSSGADRPDPRRRAGAPGRAGRRGDRLRLRPGSRRSARPTPELRTARVARARAASRRAGRGAGGQYSEGRDLGFLGEPRVNVLQLNAGPRPGIPDR